MAAGVTRQAGAMGIFRRRPSTEPSQGGVARVIDVLGEWEYDPNIDEPPGALFWLQAWYAVNCDGEWEHGYGVSMETLDNPGWSVKIEVRGTELEGRSYAGVDVERGDHDWIKATVEDGAFRAYCGPLNLGEALTAFRRWAQEPAAS